MHLLGTDESGRDVFVRLIHGGRVSLSVGFATALLTVAIGTLFGATAGFLGGVTDQILMRFTDGMMAIPVFFIVLAVVALWGSGLVVLVTVLALTRWMGIARLVRSEVIRFKTMEFVLAARGLGASRLGLLTRHILPQALPSIIVATSIGIGTVMLVEAALSFLGLGIQPPTPSWGNMLSNSQFYIWSAPQLAIYPGLMILLSVMAFNVLGDVLRDLLDPRYHSRR
jgi:peptide/nickel transport system permease protein